MLKIRHAALFTTLIVSMFFCSYASAQSAKVSLHFAPKKNTYAMGQGPDISFSLPNQIQARLALVVYRKNGFLAPPTKIHEIQSSVGTTVNSISLTDMSGVVGEEYFAVGWIWDHRKGKGKWVEVSHHSHIYEFVQGGGGDMDPNEVPGLSGL